MPAILSAPVACFLPRKLITPLLDYTTFSAVAAFHFFYSGLAARVLENSGAEGLPCSGALWESGHEHTRKRLSCGQVRAFLKVRAFPPLLPGDLP